VDWQQLVNLLVLFDERMNESSGLGDITAARLQPSDQSAFFAARALLPAPAIQQPPITSPPPILATSLQRLRASSLLNSLPSPLCIVAPPPVGASALLISTRSRQYCSHHRRHVALLSAVIPVSPCSQLSTPAGARTISPYRPDWCSSGAFRWTLVPRSMYGDRAAFEPCHCPSPRTSW
jgi:hypothetical protein